MKVLITGGASGLGLALTRACLSRGDQVSVIDLAPCPDDLSASVTHWDRVDLGQLAAKPGADIWDHLIGQMTAHGSFDLVILNAGISATGPFERITPETHLRVSAVNLHAPLQLAAALLRQQALGHGARLVFVSSLSHFTGYPGAASYAASKDGLASFARSLRKPLWRAARIRVQLFCPGPMDTPHATRYAPAGADASRRMPPARAAYALLSARPGQFWVIPGAGAKVMATAGHLMPQLATRVMGRVLFDKLKAPDDPPPR